MKNLLRLFGLASALACLHGVSFAQGVLNFRNDPAIVKAFHNQGAFSATTNYAANDVVSVVVSGGGTALYYAPTAIAASTTAPPAGAWLPFGGTSSGGTMTISGVSCAVGSVCTINAAAVGADAAGAAAAAVAAQTAIPTCPTNTVPYDLVAVGSDGHTCADTGVQYTQLLSKKPVGNQTITTGLGSTSAFNSEDNKLHTEGATVPALLSSGNTYSLQVDAAFNAAVSTAINLGGTTQLLETGAGNYSFCYPMLLPAAGFYAVDPRGVGMNATFFHAICDQRMSGQATLSGTTLTATSGVFQYAGATATTTINAGGQIQTPTVTFGGSGGYHSASPPTATLNLAAAGCTTPTGGTVAALVASAVGDGPTGTVTTLALNTNSTVCPAAPTISIAAPYTLITGGTQLNLNNGTTKVLVTVASAPTDATHLTLTSSPGLTGTLTFINQIDAISRAGTGGTAYQTMSNFTIDAGSYYTGCMKLLNVDGGNLSEMNCQNVDPRGDHCIQLGGSLDDHTSSHLWCSPPFPQPALPVNTAAMSGSGLASVTCSTCGSFSTAGAQYLTVAVQDPHKYCPVLPTVSATLPSVGTMTATSDGITTTLTGVSGTTPTVGNFITLPPSYLNLGIIPWADKVTSIAGIGSGNVVISKVIPAGTYTFNLGSGNQAVASYAVTSPGTCANSATGAAATPVATGGVIIGFTAQTNAITGYWTGATVSISGSGGGSGAVATLGYSPITGATTGLTLISGGNGYSGTLTATITPNYAPDIVTELEMPFTCFKMYTSDGSVYDYQSQGCQLGMDMFYANTKIDHYHPVHDLMGLICEAGCSVFHPELDTATNGVFFNSLVSFTVVGDNDYNAGGNVNGLNGQIQYTMLPGANGSFFGMQGTNGAHTQNDAYQFASTTTGVLQPCVGLWSTGVTLDGQDRYNYNGTAPRHDCNPSLAIMTPLLEGIGPPITAASTISPTYARHKIVGASTTINYITPPYGCTLVSLGCSQTFDFDTAQTLGTSGNITTGYSITALSSLTLRYDPADTNCATATVQPGCYRPPATGVAATGVTGSGTGGTALQAIGSGTSTVIGNVTSATNYFGGVNTGLWNNSAASIVCWNLDTCISRSFAGRLQIGTSSTTGNALGSWSAASFIASTSVSAPQYLPGTIYSAAGTALPTCAVGLKGYRSVVSDATSPTYMGAYTSGGTITVEVICSYNGSTYAWLTH